MEAVLLTTAIAILIVGLYLLANAVSKNLAGRLCERQKPRLVKLKRT